MSQKIRHSTPAEEAADRAAPRERAQVGGPAKSAMPPPARAAIKVQKIAHAFTPGSDHFARNIAILGIAGFGVYLLITGRYKGVGNAVQGLYGSGAGTASPTPAHVPKKFHPKHNKGKGFKRNPAAQ